MARLKLRFTALIAVMTLCCCQPSFANDPGGGTNGVDANVLLTNHGSHVTLGNGILTARIAKSSAQVTSMVFLAKEDVGGYGHASNPNKFGVWAVFGFDYFNDGPTKQDLAPTDGITHIHFGRNHSNASSVTVAAGESWTKFFGPWLLYCNPNSAGGDAVLTLAWAGAHYGDIVIQSFIRSGDGMTLTLQSYG